MDARYDWLRPRDLPSFLEGPPGDLSRGLALSLDTAPIASVARWLSSTAPRGLTRIELRSHPRIDEVLAAIAAAPWAAELEALVLVDCGASDGAGDSLAELAGLRSLRCYRTAIPDQAFVALSRSPRLSGLSELVLSSAGLSGGALIEMCAAPSWPLRSLVLSSNPLHVEPEVHPMAAISECPALATLEELGLSQCGLDDFAVGCLVQGPALGALRRLQLESCPLTDEAVRLLARAPMRWTELGLSQTGIGVPAIEALIRGPHEHLEQLDLSWNRAIGDRGAALLGEVDWPALQRLELHHCGISDAAILDVLGAHRWPALAGVGLDLPRGATALHRAVCAMRHLSSELRRPFAAQLSVDDLKQILAARGVRGYSKLKREALVDLVLS